MTYTILFLASTIIGLAILIRRQPYGSRSLFEPGLAIAGLFSLCYLLPAAVFLTNSVDVDSINTIDSSGFKVLVDVASQYGFVFMVCFVFAYCIKVPKYFAVAKNSAWSINISPKFCFILIATSFFVKTVMLWIYGVRSGDYIDQYAIQQSMPFFVVQMLNLLNGVRWVLIYLLLSSTFSSTPRNKSLRYIWLVFLIFFVDMLFSNSRSELVSLTIVFFAACTFYNRSFGLKKELLFIGAFTLFMNAFTFIRLTQFESADVSFLNILIPSEFMMIYRNALHLIYLSGSHDFVQPPGSSYLQAFVSFIPKQIYVEKWDPQSWYVQTYFPVFAEKGGGLAFGIIPEAIINFGLFSIAIQAFILAAIFRVTYIFAYRNRSSNQNVWIVFYLYSFSMIYPSIRYHSLIFISGFFMGIVVPFLFILVLSRITFRTNHYKNA